MISSIRWVPKGKLNPNPLMYETSPTEMKILKEQEETKVEDEEEMDVTTNNNDTEEIEEETEKQKNLNKLIQSLPADLRMDEYSSEEDDEDDGMKNMGNLLLSKDIDILDNPRLMDADEEEDDEEDLDDISSEEGHDSDDSDDDDNLADIPDTREYAPVDIEGLESMNLGSKNVVEDYDDDEEDNNSEYEDLKLLSSDAIVLVGKTKGEKSSNIGGVAGDNTDDELPSIEVNVYDTKNGNLYLHHDISLPSFPLCMCYGDYNIQQNSSSTNSQYNNYCAVGMFTPAIEIWNLDVINPLEPTLILGGDAHSTPSITDDNSKNNKKKKKKNKKQLTQLHEGSHTDAVLSLSWNSHYRNVLASGSADHTVKLWDINSSTPSSPVTTFTHHTDKVSCVEWHPSECTMLASASYDRTVCLLDGRGSTSSTDNYKLIGKAASDIECIKWDPFNEFLLTILEEDGHINSYDIRMLGNSDSKKKNSNLYWSFVANGMGGVTDISYNSVIPGMLASSSIDRSVTIYDVQSYSKSTKQLPPSFQKDMNVGKLFTLNFYPSSPWLIGCGGSQNDIALWNLDSDPMIMKHFQSRFDSSSSMSDSVISPTEGKNQEDSSLFYPKKIQEDDTNLMKKKKHNKKKGSSSKRKVHKVKA